MSPLSPSGALIGSAGSLTRQVTTVNISERLSSEDEKKIVEIIKQFATEKLGRGYRRLQNEFAPRALESTSINDVSIGNLGVHMWHLIKEDTESLFKAFKTHVGLDLDLNALFTDCKVGLESSNEKNTKKIRSFYLAARVDSYDCDLQKFPKQIEELGTSTSLYGDGFVKKMRVYTGYVILAEVEMTEGTRSSNFEAGPQVGVKPFSGAEISAFANHAQAEFKAKKMQARSSDARGFGYRPEDAQYRGHESIEALILAVNREYLNKLSSVTNPGYHIDPLHHVAKYSTLPSYRSLGVKNLRDVVSPKYEVDFESLAKKINGENESIIKKKLGGYSLGKYLSTILSTFKLTMENIDKTPFCDDPAVLVFGLSEAGKSLAIGCLMGARLKPIVVPPNKLIRWDYEDDVDTLSFPKIGHKRSETKGAAIYQQWIDTAGMMDTDRTLKHSERITLTEVVNNAAIKLLQMRYKPERLMLVLSSSDFNNRCANFFTLMKSLERIFQNSLDENICNSLLLLINDHNDALDDKGQPMNEGYIRSMIEHAIQIIEENNPDIKSEEISPEEGGALSYIKDGAKWLGQAIFGTGDQDSVAEVSEKDFDQISEVEDDLDDEIDKDEEDKFVHAQTLKSVLKGARIIISRFRDNPKKTQEEVDEWLGKGSKSDSSGVPLFGAPLQEGILAFENIVQGQYEGFKTAIEFSAEYFNTQLEMFKQKQTELEKLRPTKESDQSVSTSPSETSVQMVQRLQREISDIENNEDDVRVKVVRPNRPIANRHRLEFLNPISRKYSFTYGDVPIKKIVMYSPVSNEHQIETTWGWVVVNGEKRLVKNKRRTPIPDPERVDRTPGRRFRIPGRFRFSSEVEQEFRKNVRSQTLERCFNDGRFKATYIPSYFGHQEDHMIARIEVIGYKKDAQDSLTEIRRKLLEIQEVAKKEEVIKPDFFVERSHINDIINNLQLKNESLEANLELQQQQPDLDADVDTANNLENDIKKINLELSTYADFCKLLARIIIGLQLDQNEGSSGKVFKGFIRNFKADET